MIRSSSNCSTNRHGSERNTSSATSHHRRSMSTIFKSYRSTKKQLSLILNKADFEICHAPDETEMLEFMPSSTNEGSDITNQSEATIADDTISEQQQQARNIFTTSSTIAHKNCLITHLKHRLVPHRHEATKKDENNDEKNRGFLLIDQVDADLVLIPTDNIDQQHTRHAEPCEHGHIEEDNVDINQIRLIATTPVTPSLLPPQKSSSTSSLQPVINHSNHESDAQATQAGVECATPNYDESVLHDTQLSATNSSSSTNSSNSDPQSTNTDRSTLNDIDYVIEQKRDLERITVYEIALNNDRRDYQQDLPQNENDELDFNLRYKDAVELNLKLKEELKRLEEEKARIYSPWSCEVCTYINEPFQKTRKDVCEMCEGPSPLKRHTLTS